MNILPHIHAALIRRAAARLDKSTSWIMTSITPAEIKLLKSK